MKKILGIVLASALLWSCGSQFSRSKYDRYMWNRSAGKADKTENRITDEESNSNSKISIHEKTTELSVLDQQETGSFEVKTTSPSEIKSNEVQSARSIRKNSVTPSSSYSNEVKNKANQRAKSKIVKRNQKNPMQDGDVDAMWIVTLILCFIIPPLGVYLKDGSITGLFWLVLVLCLLGGGILFGIPGYFGGLYGVGVVLALLRFFDII